MTTCVIALSLVIWMIVITKIWDTTGRLVYASLDESISESSYYETGAGIYDICELLDVSPCMSPEPLKRHWNMFKGE